MSLTENYISIPKRLIVDLRDNPFAIALYFFVARLYLVLQAPVPLSRGDIRLFDPCAKIGTVKRALDRLVRAGWLIEQSGYKSSYVPTWGKNRAGTPYQWKIGATLLGCPWEIWRNSVRVDRALLDVFMGKFTPHRRLAADITGYFVDGEGRYKPLLPLKEIGGYILIAASWEAGPTDELQRWGLVRDDQAQPIPEDDIVLALASQRASIADFRLSRAAWYRLGWFTGTNQPEQRQEAEITPLIFVSKERIGQLIPPLIADSIGCSSFHKMPLSASASAQTAIRHTTRTMTGRSSDSQESRETPPNPPTHEQCSGGGSIRTSEKRTEGIAQIDTEAARRLFAFGVNDPDCLADLATMPFEQVGGAIAYAESEDLGPGWVVTALRRHRDEGWPLPQIRKAHRVDSCIDVAETLAKYGDLFRLGSDTSGLPNSMLEQRSPPSAALMPSQPANLVRPGVHTPAQGPPPNFVRERAAAVTQGPPPQRVAYRSAAELTELLRDRLFAQHDRYYHPLIRGLQVRVAETTTIIHCATLSDRLAVLDVLLGVLRHLCTELGLPRAIRVTEQPPPPDSEPPKGNDPPTNGLPLSA
jgi:hypothetical protein